MFIAMILAVILGGNTYVIYRLWNMIPQGNPLRWVVLCLGVVAAASAFVAMFVGNRLPLALTGFLYKLGTSWFMIMLYLVMIFLVLDIARLCGAPLRQFMFGNWTGLAAVVGLVAVIFIAGNITYYNKKRVDLPVETVKELSRDVKIVAVSDLHLGYTISPGEVEKWVKLINAERPDVVLIAGDLIDNGLRVVRTKDYAGVLRGIEARYGVYMAPGNHEYISGIDQSASFIRDAGINLLSDEAVLVDSLFYIAGRDDRSNPHRQSVQQLTAGLDKSKPVILMDHQPYELEKAEAAGVDLQISGHTHRGQVWPITWITDSMYEKSQGYLRKGGSHFYVSSGLGIWGGKYRIGSRSEYVVITLSGK